MDDVERPDDLEKERNGTSRRWLQQIDEATNRDKKWHRSAEKTEETYEDEDQTERFNILFSNTQTLLPALYNSTPRPDVRRRFRDADPVGKVVSEVLERSLSYSVDSYDFDDTVEAVILDYLLPGRGVLRVRYVPHYGDATRDRIPVQVETGLEGNTYVTPDGMVDTAEVQFDTEGAFTLGDEYEPVVHEEAVCEHVGWDDFVILGSARKWQGVEAIAFRHRMDRETLEAEFGEAGAEAPLNWTADTDKAPSRDEADMTKRAEVWEVWDKNKRRVVFVVQGYDKVLDVREDPLNLDGFFPVPRPILSIRKPRSLIPKPEYYIYKAQAEELNKVSSRIIRLTDAIKARGVYNPLLGDSMSRMMDDTTDAILQPADAETINQMFAQGDSDFRKAVWMMPVDMLVGVLVQLTQQREVIKQTIYEITGISDIIRGATDPNETASAQRIKSQFGSLRLNNRQREVQRLVRDIFRLKAEIYAEHFSPETLEMMTGVKLPTEAEKAQAQQAIQAVQHQQQMMAQMGDQLPPEAQQQAQQYQQQAQQAQEIMKKPSWEQVMQLMRDDLQRGYRIDVESDSTIQADEAYDQRTMTELYKGIADFSSVMGPLVQQGMMPMDAVKQMLLSAVRKFKMGRQVEDALEEIPDKQPQQQDGAAQQAQIDMQVKQAEAQMKMQEMQAKAQFEQQRMAMDMQKMQAEAANDQAEIAIKREELGIKQAELQIKRAEVAIKRDESQISQAERAAD